MDHACEVVVQGEAPTQLIPAWSVSPCVQAARSQCHLSLLVGTDFSQMFSFSSCFLAILTSSCHLKLCCDLLTWLSRKDIYIYIYIYIYTIHWAGSFASILARRAKMDIVVHGLYVDWCTVSHSGLVSSAYRCNISTTAYFIWRSCSERKIHMM